MNNKPQWYNMLPNHLRPTDNKISELETLRARLDFPHKLFMMGIANSRWAVIKAQEATLERLKSAMPNATDKELWKVVLISRLEMHLKSPIPYGPQADEILHRIETAGDLITNINSFQALLDYILKMEEKNLDDSDIIQKQIDKALFE